MAVADEHIVQSIEADMFCARQATTSDEVRPSVLMRFLPSLMGSKVAHIPSLRRSVSKVPTPKHSDDESWPNSRSETPPPRYRSRKSSEATIELENRVGERRFGPFNQTDVSRPSSSRSASPPQPTETSSGINWKFANQGLNLLSSALQELSMLSGTDGEGSSSFIRKLYVHGLTFLLRGLPADLSTEETLSIRSAIPGEVRGNLAILPATRENELYTVRTDTAPRGAEPPSFVQRILATGIVQVFIMVHLLLPYVKLLVGHVYRLDRTHHISERMFRASLTTVNEVSRAGIQLADSVCGMNDGKVGQAINDLTIWWIRSIAGGITQGLDGGIEVLGLSKPEQPTGKTGMIDG